GITTTTDANGNYSFGNLAPGTYGVKFTDTVSGKTLIAPDANGNANDDIDSDATDLGNGMSEITGITVVAGQDTPDNDAGVETLPGSLSGTYFCDENRDGLDNDGSFVAGVTVELLDAAGNGTGITTTTDANGNYSFGNLAPGTYGVKFTDTVSGKTLIAPDANGNAN
ncbi:MAG: SdrD B-like domain-containing protein, partial [Bacteroidota bacterium]